MYTTVENKTVLQNTTEIYWPLGSHHCLDAVYYKGQHQFECSALSVKLSPLQEHRSRITIRNFLYKSATSVTLVLAINANEVNETHLTI